AEHSRFSFNSADTPAEYAESVDHCSVGVCTHKCIRISDETALFFSDMHNIGQILQVDLVHNTCCWRYSFVVVKCFSRQVQEFITLLVPFELKLHVLLKCIVRTVLIALYGELDYEIDRHCRADFLNVATDIIHHVPELRHVDTCENP